MFLWFVMLLNFSVSDFLKRIMVIEREMIGNSKLLNKLFVLSMLKIGLIIILIINNGKIVGSLIL